MKRTIYIGNPAYLKCHLNQMVIIEPSAQVEKGRVSIEDLGVLILDHSQITITHYLLQQIMQNGGAVVSCDDKHIPYSISLPFTSNTQHTQRIRQQAKQTQQQKNRLWKQVVIAKITNQAAVLKSINMRADKLIGFSQQVKTGDSTNREGIAAKIYWSDLFGDFIRERHGHTPNHLLNYGYAILRSMVCRALTRYGLHLALGIHHIGKYNPTCLADDMMEPYRPYIDAHILNYINSFPDFDKSTISQQTKTELLSIGQLDVLLNKKTFPLQIAVDVSAKSLMKTLDDNKRNLDLPNLWGQLCSTETA